MRRPYSLIQALLVLCWYSQMFWCAALFSTGLILVQRDAQGAAYMGRASTWQGDLSLGLSGDLLITQPYVGQGLLQTSMLSTENISHLGLGSSADADCLPITPHQAGCLWATWQRPVCIWC